MVHLTHVQPFPSHNHGCFKFIQMNHHHPPVIMTPHTQCEGIYYDPAGVYVIFKQLGQPI